MLSRRSFLVSAGAGMAAGSLSSSIAFANHHIKIPLGIQLWTVKSEAEKDLEGTLRKVYARGLPRDRIRRLLRQDRRPTSASS